MTDTDYKSASQRLREAIEYIPPDHRHGARVSMSTEDAVEILRVVESQSMVQARPYYRLAGHLDDAIREGRRDDAREIAASIARLLGVEIAPDTESKSKGDQIDDIMDAGRAAAETVKSWPQWKQDLSRDPKAHAPAMECKSVSIEALRKLAKDIDEQADDVNTSPYDSYGPGEASGLRKAANQIEELAESVQATECRSVSLKYEDADWIRRALSALASHPFTEPGTVQRAGLLAAEMERQLRAMDCGSVDRRDGEG